MPKMDEIRHVINGFDIFCICETWLSNSVTDPLINIPGYVCFRQDRRSNTLAGNTGLSKGGGGICIYVHNKYAVYAEVNNEISNVSVNIEQLWITINCPNVKKKNHWCHIPTSVW